MTAEDELPRKRKNAGPARRTELALLLLCSLSLLIGAQLAAAQEQPLAIGFIAPLTGPKASFGAPAREGFELGLRQCASRLHVQYEDDQFVPSQTVAAFKRFVESRRAGLVITVGSATGNAVAPLAQEHRMPLIAWAADSRVSHAKPWVIRPYFGEREAMQLTAEEAKRLGYRDIAVLVSINDFPLAVKRAFLEHAAPGTVKAAEEFPPDAMDFRTLLMKVKAKGIKQLFICALGGQTGALAKQAHAIGFKPEIFGCSNLAAPAELEVSGGSLAGAWLFNPKISADFRTLYRKTYGPSGELWPAALFYDLAFLLEQATNGPVDAKTILPRLLNTASPGAALSGFRLIQRNGDQYLEVDLEKCVVGEKDC